MCGIVSVMAFGENPDKEVEKIRQEAMILLTSELLQLTQPRGKDATGIATMFENCDYMGLKMGVSAMEFIGRLGNKETDYGGFVDLWRRHKNPARMVIGHCRKPSATIGAGTEDNQNNHPIRVGHIVGVHNGTLTNHAQIVEKLKCETDSKVDSEAIFRLMHFYTRRAKEPFSMQLLQSVCQRLHGTFACLAFSGNNPHQLVAFRDGRPMEAMLIKPLNLVVIASEEQFLHAATFRYNRIVRLYNPNSSVFPQIKKGDLEIKTLPDRSIFMFDLRQKIGKTTTITDVVQQEKIPTTGKLWAKPVTTTTHNAGFNQYNNRASVPARTPAYNPHTRPANNTGNGANTQTTEKKTTGNAGSTTGASSPTNETGVENRVGLAWNREKNEYKSVNGVASTKDHGSVDLSLYNQKPTPAEEDLTNPNFVLVPDDTPLDREASNGTRLEVDKVETVGNTSPSPPAKEEIPTGATVKEIDVSQFPDVLEEAVERASQLPKFTDDDEAATSIDLDDTTYFKSMSPFSLVNRSRRTFFQEGWFEGYVTCLLRGGKDKDPDKDIQTMLLERHKEKHRRMQKTLRAVKIIAKMLDGIGNKSNDDVVREIVNKSQMAGKYVNPQELSKVFRAGDLREMPTLRKILQALDNTAGG